MSEPPQENGPELSKVSVIILTWNSGATVRRALESVRGCADILLVDGGSTDDTLAIGKEFGARVVPQPGGAIADFALVRNIGLRAAAQPWILYLDSDEYLSPEAMEGVRQAAMTSKPAALLVGRRYVTPEGELIEHATTYPNERIYFFHRDAVTGWTRPVHEKVLLKTGIPVFRLPGWTCAPLGTIDDYWRKNKRYLRLEQEQSRKQGWAYWIRHRLLRAIRAQLVSMARLAWIWLLPRSGKRLPLSHELARWRYRWRLLRVTMPGSQDLPQ